MALTESSRTTFANSVVEFIVKYGFDGVDIDWEYPVSGGLTTNVRRAEDKQNFTLLMKTLREKLDARGAKDGKKYLLSFAGAAGSWYLKNIEASKVSSYVDYINVMTYDIHGSWETTTDFNAPLYNYGESNTVSVASSMDAWVKAGVSKSKLVMGVPFYGYIYHQVTEDNQGLFQKYSGAASISYSNIVGNYLKDSSYQLYFHEQARVPWLSNGSTFVSFENEQSMKEKAYKS